MYQKPAKTSKQESTKICRQLIKQTGIIVFDWLSLRCRTICPNLSHIAEN